MKLKLILLFLFCNSVFVFASRVDTLRVMSKSMNKTISNVVVVPDTYAAQKEGFPVLYLLHGAGGNYRDWVSKVPAIKE